MLLNNDLSGARNAHNLTIVMNVAISSLILFALVGLFSLNTPIYSNKAHLSSAFTQVSTLKAQLTSEYAYLGHWPKKSVLKEKGFDSSGVIERIQFDGEGTINIFFSDQQIDLSNKVLSFTAAHITSSTDINGKNTPLISSIVWVCGYAEVPEYYDFVGTNITNINSKYLPRSCK